MALEECPGCGVRLPALDGPVHRYIESSPSCWAAYGEVLAREYGDPAYMANHRLTVDAYAVQHPGRPSPQSIQSVAAHLISLHAVLELGSSHSQATRLIGRCVERLRFEWLEPPAERGGVVVTHVLATDSTETHAEAVRAWAEATWSAWAVHHAQVRAWAKQAF